MNLDDKIAWLDARRRARATPGHVNGAAPDEDDGPSWEDAPPPGDDDFRQVSAIPPPTVAGGGGGNGAGRFRQVAGGGNGSFSREKTKGEGDVPPSDPPTSAKWRNDLPLPIRIARITDKPLDPERAPMPGLFVKGKASGLLAPGDAGKTTLTDQLGAEFANSGGPLTGELSRQYVSLFVNAEDEESDERRTVLGASADPDPCVYRVTPARPVTADHLAAWCAAIKAEAGLPVDFIVINPFLRCLRPERENDADAVELVTAPIVRLARELDVGVVFVHHTNKGAGEGRDKARGSTALFDACDLWCDLEVIKRHESWVLRFQKSRGLPRRKPLSLVSDGKGYFQKADHPHIEASASRQAVTCASNILQRKPGRPMATGELIAEAVRITGIASRTVERALLDLRKEPCIDYSRGEYTFRARSGMGGSR